MPLLWAFVSSRLGIALIALVTGLSAGYYRGWDSEHVRCAAEQARLAAASAKRDSDIAMDSDTDDKTKLAELSALLKQHEAIIDALRKTPPSAADCRPVSADDLH